MRKILTEIKNLFDIRNNIMRNDPVYACRVYRNFGCSHVDGPLCDMKTCIILDTHNIHELEQQLDIPIKLRMNYDKKD